MKNKTPYKINAKYLIRTVKETADAKQEREMKTEEENEKENEKLFEEIWDNYWWKKRGFGYRCSNSEVTEREIVATAFETYLKELKDLKNEN